MRGMNRLTGKVLSGREHLVQSLQVLFSTPIGSRVMLPGFGSELIDLIDSPITDLSRLQINNAIFNAVALWEPRLKINRITGASRDLDGELIINIEGVFEGEQVSITGLRVLTPSTPVVIPDPPPVEDTEVFAFLSGNDNLFISENDNIFVFDEVV